MKWANQSPLQLWKRMKPGAGFIFDLEISSQIIKNYFMIAKTDLAKMYETLLTIPGMNSRVKIDLKIPLRNALLLSKVIERGLLGKDLDDSSINIIDLISPELSKELSDLPNEISQKAGLIEMNEKIKSFNGK
jgi:hypothetical protein